MSLHRQQHCLEPEIETSRPLSNPSKPGLHFTEASFLGVSVHAMTVSGFHQVIAAAIETGQKWLIAHHNLHSLYLLHKDGNPGSSSGTLQRFYKKARWVQADGMSMILLARLHGYAIRRRHRIAHNVSLPSLLKLAQVKNWRVMYLGSSEFVSTKGGNILRASYPGLNLQTHHGFFEKEKASFGNQAVLAQIAAFQPHVLFVGMGMPHQEIWVEENYDALHANVIVTSGATLDYFAGALPIPPRWVGMAGLEWLYRLAHEPRRLGFRYLGEPCLLLASLAKQKLRLK